MRVRRRRNGLRAAVLIGAVDAALVLTGSRFGWRGVLAAAALALAVSVASVYGADTLLLRVTRARPVSEAQQPRLYAVVRELSTAARLPMPRLYVIHTPAPTVFATGRGPRSGAICCTAGALRLLNERQLRGVLAHELTHLRRRDTLLAGVAGTVAGLVLVLGGLVLLLPRTATDDDKSPGPLSLLALIVLGPIAGLIVRLAVSRGRETEADTAAALLTGDPAALAEALRALDVAWRATPSRLRPPVAAAHFMINDPVAGRRLARLLSTHPPLRERLARLDAMAGSSSPEA